jgi:hypothetical protein
MHPEVAVEVDLGAGAADRDRWTRFVVDWFTVRHDDVETNGKN